MKNGFHCPYFFHLPSRQGSLDVKYLSDRYAKGKEEISKLLAEKHRIVRHPSICLGHSAIVQMQGEMGPDGYLISNRSSHNHERISPMQNVFLCLSLIEIVDPHTDTLRLTILIADATLWPTRAWNPTEKGDFQPTMFRQCEFPIPRILSPY